MSSSFCTPCEILVNHASALDFIRLYFHLSTCWYYLIRYDGRLMSYRISYAQLSSALSPLAKYTDIAVRIVHCRTATGTRMPYGITQRYLPCHPAELTVLPLPEPKLLVVSYFLSTFYDVLFYDLAITEKSKAET